MATVTASQVGDITNFYLENFMQDKWADAVRPYQQYITATELFTKRRERDDASERVSFNLKVNEADNTVADSFFKEDTINRVDLGIKGEVKWHFQKTHFSVDNREPAMLSGSKTRILRYLDMMKSDMYDGFFKKNENWLWSLPAAPNDGTAGDPLPLGIPYWIVQSATAAFGFNGQHPTNYSDVGNVSSITYDQWRNGTFTYASMSNADFCKKLSEALDKCDFDAPYPMAGEEVPSRNYGLYSTYKPFQDYQDLLYASNDDIGEDMGRYRGGRPQVGIGKQTFRGVPWCWVPALDKSTSPAYDSNNPVYGINWDTFSLRTYGDIFMRRAKAINLHNAHNTVVEWMDTGYQLCCRNRRSNFVGRAA